MANAYGFFTPSVQSVRGRINPSPSVGVYGFGFCSNKGIATRVLCSSSVEGVEKLGSGVSASESRVPR